MNHPTPAVHGGHLPGPAMWGAAALAVAYIGWAVITWDRSDPGQLAGGQAARRRLIRAGVSLAVAAVISGVFVMAYNRERPARVAASAVRGHISVHATLMYGWAGVTVVTALVLILVSSAIARHRRPLPAAAPRRRGRKTAAPAYPPPGYPPAGWPPTGTGYERPPSRGEETDDDHRRL